MTTEFTPDERLVMGHDLRARFVQIMRDLEPGATTTYGTTGGGTMCVQVEMPSGYHLVSSLETARSEGEHSWTGWDFNEPDGNCIATVHTYARPLFAKDPADPAEVHVQQMRLFMAALK